MNIGIDRARRVRQADAMFQRQTRSRARLYLIAFGYRHGKAGRDGVASARRQYQFLGRYHVHAGGLRGRVGGQGQPSTMGQALDPYFNRRKG